MNQTANETPLSLFEQEKRHKREIRFVSTGIALGFIALTVTSYAVSIGLGFVPGFSEWYYSMDPNTAYTIFNLILYILGFGVAIIVSKLFLRIPAKVAFPMRRVPFGTLVSSIPICLGAITIGAYITNILGNLLIQYAGYAPQAPDFHRPDGIVPNILYFISIGILPAFFEEFLCRGVVLHSLRKYGDGFALIISSVIFGLMHGNLVQAPYAIVVGLVMGYFVLYTGSLIPAMVAHAINNSMEVVFEWIAISTTVEQDNFIYYAKTITYLVLAIAGIVYLRVKHGSLFYVKPSKLSLSEGKKYTWVFTSAAMIIYLIWVVIQMVQAMAPA